MLELKNSKTTEMAPMPDGRRRFAVDGFIGAVQMCEPGKEWQDIRPHLVRDIDGWHIEGTPYYAEIKDDGTRLFFPDRDERSKYLRLPAPALFSGLSKNILSNPARLDGVLLPNQVTMLTSWGEYRIIFSNTGMHFEVLFNKAPPNNLFGRDSPEIVFDTDLAGFDIRKLLKEKSGLGIPSPRLVSKDRVLGKHLDWEFKEGHLRLGFDFTGLDFPVLLKNTTVDKQVGASGNDGYRYTGALGFSSGTAGIRMGWYNNADYYNCNIFARFTGITLEGAISTAYLQLWGRGASSNLQMRWQAVDEDNPDAPTSAAEYDGDPLTTEYVDAVEAMSSSAWNNMAEIKAVIQELVDSYTISNEAIMIYGRNVTGAGSSGLLGDYDWSTTGGPKIHIEYSTVGNVTVTPNPLSLVLTTYAPTVRISKLFEYYNTGDDDWRPIDSDEWCAQTFTPAQTHTVTSVKIKLQKLGSGQDIGDVIVSIKAVDGSGNPTGADLCSGSFDGDTLSVMEFLWTEIFFDSGYLLLASTKYAIVVTAPESAPYAGYYVGWASDESSPTYENGCMKLYVESEWITYEDKELLFEEWGTEEEEGVIVTPSTLSLVLTTYVPTVTVTGNQVVTPGTISLTLTTYAPVVTVTDNIEVTPVTLALNITLYAPTVIITGDVVCTPTTLSLVLTTYAPTVTITGVVSVQVGASADDGFIAVGTGGLYDVNTSNIAGKTPAEYVQHAFYRFTGITIPKGSIITSCYIALFEAATVGSPLTKIYFEKANDPGQISSEEDYLSRELTTAGVEWNGDPGANAWYDSPSLVAVMKELIDTYGLSDQAIQVMHKDNGSSTGNYRSSYSWDYSDHTQGAKLFIQFKTAAPVVCTPPTLSLTLTTYAPTVTATENVVCTPTTLSLVLTTYSPTVSTPRTVIPSTLALTLTTYAPTVSTPILVTPSTLALVINTYAPTVTATDNVTVTPSTLALLLTTYAPTITTTSNILVRPSTLALVLTLYAPVVIVPARMLKLYVITSQPLDIKAITSQHRSIETVTSQHRDIKVITSGG